MAVQGLRLAQEARQVTALDHGFYDLAGVLEFMHAGILLYFLRDREEKS
jgi:hypothetical protein